MSEETAYESLDDVLRDADEGDPGIVPEATGEPIPADQDTEDHNDEGDEDKGAPPAPKEPAKEPDAKADDKQDFHVPGAALIAEREKRQAAERRYAEIEAQLRALQQPGAKRPSVLDDEEGAFRHVSSELQSQLRSELIGMRVEMSQEMMRAQHPDYDEAEAEFLKLAEANPLLRHELATSPMPAQYVYRTVQQHRELAELKDTKTLRSKIEAEVRAEVEKAVRAELEASLKQEAAKRDAVMPSLAKGGSDNAIERTEPESLEEILQR